MKIEDLKEGDRILFKYNGIQLAGTVDYDDFVVNYDFNAGWCSLKADGFELIRKLEGVEACRAGDTLVDKEFNQYKVLEIGNSHTAALLSYSSQYKMATYWYAFAELIKDGYRLQGQEEKEELVELTLDEIANKLNIDVEKLRIKE